MTEPPSTGPTRTLILAPFGRDAEIATLVLREAGIDSGVCADLAALHAGCGSGAGAALIVEEVLQEQDYRVFADWIARQPPWSDFPIILLAQRGGGLERNRRRRATARRWAT